MHHIKNKAVARYRQHAQQRGVARLEVQVPRQDAEPMRLLAALLRGHDPDLAEQTRKRLKALVSETGNSRSLKELLVAAPLEGLTFDRVRDTGRPVELL
jgi:hypothetical protein